MPNLDSCITDIFDPINTPSDPGETPVSPGVPPIHPPGPWPEGGLPPIPGGETWMLAYDRYWNSQYFIILFV